MSARIRDVIELCLEEHREESKPIKGLLKKILRNVGLTACDWRPHSQAFGARGMET